MRNVTLPAAVTRALARFRAALEVRFGPRLLEVVLYGSYARGDAHEDSDVDVLVVVRGLTDAERGDVMDIAYDADAAERDAWVGLSPLPYADTQVGDLRARERRLLREIDSQGVRL